MGSRIMHLAIANELLTEYPDLDRNRFLFGTLLPDAATEGNSHARIDVCDGGQFVYGACRWDPAPPGNIERLHRDYAILNGYLIGKYRLSPDVAIQPGVEAEPLLRDCSYDPDALVRELKADFAQKESGALFFFRRDMADEYIVQSLPYCRREIAAVQTGSGFMDELSMAWARKGL